MPNEFIINEYVRDLECKLLEELQKQMPEKIISSIILLELESKKVVAGNFGQTRHTSD